MKTVYFDLDGTILDVSERIWRVYRFILKERKKRFLPKDRYLKLKREKRPIEEILKKTKAEDTFSNYKKEWLKNIESEKYLNLDRLSPERRKILFLLKGKYNLVLITARKKRKQLHNQLHQKGISDIFSKVLLPGDGLRARIRAIKKHGKC